MKLEAIMSFTQLNQIINGDSVEVMKSMPDECVDLTVTSPPYDSLRSYQDLIDGMKEEYNGYSFPFEQMAQELYRITAKGGIIVWVVGDAVIKGSETGSSFRQALYFMELGFKLHDTMIYEKNGSSFPAKRDGNRYSQLFEYMFVFSKGKPKTSNLICDKANRWAGYTHFGKGSIRNKKGELVERNIKPIPEFSPRNNIWKYNTGKNYSTKDKIAFQHPAIFPEKLAGDHILTWTNEGDVVFDPMAGSGTTPKMALINNRNYVGIEISEDYCEIARTRISDTENLMEEESQSRAIAN
jgi:site-specific DNA-methyltransferase (adenine-specific)